MKIYAELAVFLFLLLIFSSWKVWEIFSKKRLLKNYSVDNDKSKNGELKQREIRESEQRAATGNKQGARNKDAGTRGKNADPIRPPKPTGRNVLPKTKPRSSGKNRSSFREFIKGRRKR